MRVVPSSLYVAQTQTDVNVGIGQHSTLSAVNNVSNDNIVAGTHRQHSPKRKRQLPKQDLHHQPDQEETHRGRARLWILGTRV